MHRLHKLAAALCLVIAIIAAGSVTTFAKSSANRSRALSGLVLDVDRAGRTLVVREFGTNQTYRVQLPAGRTVRTNQVWSPNAGLDQLAPGMMIYDASVR